MRQKLRVKDLLKDKAHWSGATASPESSVRVIVLSPLGFMTHENFLGSLDYMDGRVVLINVCLADLTTLMYSIDFPL